MGQLVSIAHFMTSNIFFLKRTQHLNCLYMSIDLVFVLKWVKILLDACSIYSISLLCPRCMRWMGGNIGWSVASPVDLILTS